MSLRGPDEFTVVGDVYTFRWPGVEITLDRFRENRDEISAEMTIYSTNPSTRGLLYHARMNLMAATTRKQVAEMLSSRVEYDWYGVLQAVCTLAVARWREGDPVVRLMDVGLPSTRWLLFPYIEVGSPTVLFAFGGSGKSVLALAMAYTVAAGLGKLVGTTDMTARPVLYLDWETSAETHSERLRALMAKHPPPLEANSLPLFYKRMTASLSESSAAVRKEIARTGAQLVVIDSLGYAGGASPEEAATAINVFAAIRSFGIAALCIHHRRKGPGQKGGDPDSLFGSAYYFNSARHVWQLQSAKNETDDTLSIALIHAKANNGRLQKRHGFEVSFTNNDSGLTVGIGLRYRDNVAEIPGVAEHAPLADRIIAELARGAMTVSELADTLDANRATVKARLSELHRSGKVVQVPGERWGLLAGKVS